MNHLLRRIAANLEGRGLSAFAGARVKQAATERVFGLEIMPAPFVVAHLQGGLTMQALDAPLADDGNERASVFLTNALAGSKPYTTKPRCPSPVGGGTRLGGTGEVGDADPRYPRQSAL